MTKRGRNDPYKGFDFQVAFSAALAMIAGFALGKKLLHGVAAKCLKPNDYVADVPATRCPIEGVGTTVSPLPTDRSPSPPKPTTKRRTSNHVPR